MSQLAFGRHLASRVVFSGIQPTGVPHIGNYIGALKQWVDLQRDEASSTKLKYCVVDLHAITTKQDPVQLRLRKREVLASLLAIGIDPDRSTVFYQSSVPAHSELMWILACTASVGYLSRMTQWKTKLNISGVSGLSDKNVGTNLKLGLFSYPVLQAADILVHRATHVPVGDDQKQHLEFARECVTNFNSAYGDHLVHPETITPPAKRVMSLAQPTAKMSKSHKSDRSRILLSDSPQEIRTKISFALTDSLPGISYDPKERPGISNLLEICSIFDAAGRDVNSLANECGDMQPRVFKEFVSDTIISGLDGVRDRYLDLMKRSDNYLAKVEEHGAERARQSAQETMDIVKSAIGF